MPSPTPTRYPDPAPPEPGVSRVPRRLFLGRLTLAGVGISLVPTSRAGAKAPKGKLADHPLASFDRTVGEFMRERKVPGGALAVVKDRRLVYARGYGWADRERQEPVRPESLFRIASISKPITAVGVLKLAEAGKLDLDAHVFDLVKADPFVAEGKTPDARLPGITVRQCLQHTGGWDRGKSFDPMFRAVEIAEALGVPRPAGPRDVIRYVLGQPLDFDPGTRYAYSNFGYCVLGRLLERLSGLDYERCIREQVLAGIGIRRMRVGASLAGGRAPDEVRYYTAKRALGPSVFPGDPPKVPWPYGGFHLEAMDAHGGWLASAVDLARFAAALDDPAQCPLLKPATLETMYAPPAAPVARKPDGSLEAVYYGCGWSIRRVRGKGKANYWHTGSLPGTSTLLVRRWDGLSWVVLFNQRSEDGKHPDGAIDPALHGAADAVKEWPATDLFSQFA
jgi:N-acyl-D-amino-acid deacylase